MRRVERGNSLLVCVIEQNALAAEFLLNLLHKDPSIHALLLEEYCNGVWKAYCPLFLVDNCGLSLPLTELLQRLTARHSGARFLVLDRQCSKDDIVRMLFLGVHGFLEHRSVGERLQQAVHTVSEGQLWFSPEVLQLYVQFTARANRRGTAGPESITPREYQIIELVKRRLSNQEIASLLRIKECTVKFHLSNIFSKFQVGSRRKLLDQNVTVVGWTRLLA
jgi:DNA-binding NarL/FixJ family response regulator